MIPNVRERSLRCVWESGRRQGDDLQFPVLPPQEENPSHDVVQGWKASTPANKTLAAVNKTGKLLAFLQALEVEFILEFDPEELLATSPAPAITPL